ncbi:MAG: hypothetical protein NTW85_12835 [Methylococcales bacterium]|nr:hypothetical protein [Methylococcales bacterium]
MNKFLKNSASSLAMTALALACGNAMAHPSFMNGGIGGKALAFAPATATTVMTAPSRPTNDDAIQINHGCVGADRVTISEAVVANSWIWPKGLGDGMAPMSTGCDSSGASCLGVSEQPSVARIPDSSKKPNLNGADNPIGMGSTTRLENELVHASVSSCTTVGHSTTCNSVPGSSPVTSLGGLAQFQGNLGYFNSNVSRPNGFYAKNAKYDANQIAAMGYSSVAAPYHNTVQITWADPKPDLASGVTKSVQTPVPYYFSGDSCARRVVVRLAGVDICKASLKDSPKQIAAGDSVNFWMGGPTHKFNNQLFSVDKVAHGMHENFWINYTLMVRDTVNNPYPASCTNKVKGDYDLVVMPTIKEIDSGLPFPGFANEDDHHEERNSDK